MTHMDLDHIALMFSGMALCFSLMTMSISFHVAGVARRSAVTKDQLVKAMTATHRRAVETAQRMARNHLT